MDMLSRERIRSIADSLLDSEIGPVPRFRLLRDALLLPPDHTELVRTKEAVLRTKWVRDILSLQHGDGSWGYFHSLSFPTKEQPMTTEQALRRLLVLGLDTTDAPIQRAVSYLEGALCGQIRTPDRVEKTHRWDIYMPLMLAALELLSEYSQARPILTFAAGWLTDQMVDGRWDMGTLVKDGAYFPLSDSWRSSGTREVDCTVRILALLTRLYSE